MRVKIEFSYKSYLSSGTGLTGVTSRNLQKKVSPYKKQNENSSFVAKCEDSAGYGNILIIVEKFNLEVD